MVITMLQKLKQITSIMLGLKHFENMENKNLNETETKIVKENINYDMGARQLKEFVRDKFDI